MSLQLIHDEFQRFLGDKNPEVLCITGKWGVGKTYSWSLGLKKAQENKGVLLDRYAYVSLFGQNSLDDLKYAIFESTVHMDQLERGPDFRSLNSSIKAIETIGRNNLFLANVFPWSRGFTSGAGRALFLSVRNQIVCIDDLERAGKGLEVKDVLGMISYLKEQRNCKVVLLLNDEALPSEGKKEFETQLEKIVDTRLVFSPSPKEAAEIAVDTRTTFHQLLAANSCSLGITNVRVIKKIQALCVRLQEVVNKFDSEVLKQVVQTTTLFGWIHYEPGIAPPLDIVVNRNSWPRILANKEAPEEEKKWYALLDSYQFVDVDDLDAVLLEGIKVGFFNVAEIEKAASAMQARLDRQKKDNSFNEAWNLFHDSFVVDADEVVDKMSTAFRRNIDVISPLNMNGTVRLFKELGRPEEAKELIQQYMNGRDEGQAFYDLDNSHMAAEDRDPDVVSAFSEKLKSFPVDVDPTKLLVSIALNRGWNNGDLECLAQLSSDDFKRLFKESAGADLRRMIQASLQFGSFANASESMKKIASAATQALREIGSESKINASRVKRYGISVPVQ